MHMPSSDSPAINQDSYYMGIAMAVRDKANCTGNRVGAVIVRENRVISTGYNGTPEGMKNCNDGGCLRCNSARHRFESGTGYDLCICVHAEQNALLSAARFGVSVDQACMYTTMQPCFGCLKELVQANLKKVFYLHSWIPSHPDPELDQKVRDEYAKLEARLHLKRLNIPDPKDIWAVTALRKATGMAEGHSASTAALPAARVETKPQPGKNKTRT